MVYKDIEKRRQYCREYMQRWLERPGNREKMRKWARERAKKNYVPHRRNKTGKLLRCVFCGAILMEDDGTLVESARDHYVEYQHGVGCKNFNIDEEWNKLQQS
jgi:hypothetical protein